MQQKELILIGAGAFLLVLGSTSYGADLGASSTAMASDPPTVSDPQSIYLIKENPFFIRFIEKAVKHAREAEIAGNLGQAQELLVHARESLEQAREAQRAGSVPGVNEGIAYLRKAFGLPTQAPMQASPSQPSPNLAQGVNPQCIDELERQCGDVQPGGGRIQQCFDDKIDNFSPMCQQQLKVEGKAGIAAAIVDTKHQKELAATPRMPAPIQASPSLAQGVNPQCIDELERQCGEVQPGGGRIQQCFDDKIDNFSPMCQKQLKVEGKAGIAAAIVDTKHQKELAATPREASSVQEWTNYVREARKNFSQAAGIKFVDLKPQAAVPTR